jgi:hypothetical protein
MDDFLFKLALSFIVGGVWIGTVTVAAERLGTEIGGILSGLPTTAPISLLFIGWNQGVVAAAQSSVMVPAVMGLNATFLMAYAILLPKGKISATLSAIAVWAVLAGILMLSGLSDITVSTSIFLFLAFLSFLVMEYGLKVQSQKIRALKHSFKQLLSRGLIGGGIVAFAVYVAKIGGTLLGGLFSTFPATYLSIIVIFSREYNSIIGKAMAKSMVVGSTAICVFGIVVNLYLRVLGLGLGILLGYVCSILVLTIPMSVMRRMK